MIDKALLKKVSKVVTHADCPDGYASALILRDVFDDGQEIQFVRYGTKEHEDLAVEPGMLFCDFSPPRKRWREFFDAGAIVLDHHKSIADVVREFEKAGLGAFADEETQPGVSGALLAFEHVWRHYFKTGGSFGDTVRNFAKVAGVRDTWQKQSGLWRTACAQAAELRFHGEKALSRIVAFECPTDLGFMLLKKEEEAAAQIAKHAWNIKISDLGTISLLPTTNISDAADLLLQGGDVAVVAGFRYSIDQQRIKLNFSLRAAGAVDVGAVAKAYGGGGHKNAAGFTVDEDELELHVEGLPATTMDPYDFAANRLAVTVAFAGKAGSDG